MANEKLNILKLLIENQGTLFSIRKISQLRKINYKSAYLAVKKLEKEGIVALLRTGNTINCSFNKKFNSSVFEVESERRVDLIKNPNLKLIYNDLKRINLPFIAVLFGSYVKGMQTKHSDIDLLVVAEDARPILQVLSLRPFKIHVTDVTYKDFISMLKSKEFTAVSEAVQKNIILNGIDEYYRLIENAG